MKIPGMMVKYAYKEDVPAFGVPTMKRFGHFSIFISNKMRIYVIVKE